MNEKDEPFKGSKWTYTFDIQLQLVIGNEHNSISFGLHSVSFYPTDDTIQQNWS